MFVIDKMVIWLMYRNMDQLLYIHSQLFSSVFTVLVVSPTGSRPPSRNRNNEMPGDEELGFEAAVAALGGIACSDPANGCISEICLTKY